MRPAVALMNKSMGALLSYLSSRVRPEATIALCIRTLSGRIAPLRGKGHWDFVTTRNRVASALGVAPSSVLRISQDGRTWRPGEGWSLKRQCPGNEAELLVEVVQPSGSDAPLVLRRHIYRSGGGPPPARQGSLISTEEVRMDPAEDMGRWGSGWEQLVQGVDHVPPPAVFLLRDLLGAPAPRLWVDVHCLRELKPLKGLRAVDVFAETKDVAVLTRLRGTD